MPHPRAMTLALLFTASGCTSLPSGNPPGNTGIDGAACVGTPPTSAPGLVEIANPALLVQARLATGKGGECAAKVFSVTAPLVVYRVFDSNKPQSKLGRWWSLRRPSGPRDGYRSAYAICPEWSKLDRLIACEVRPGTEIVVGTTQSATCKDGRTYPKTADYQAFIPNDGRAGISHVGACSEETRWP